MSNAHDSEAAVRRALAALDLNLLPVLDALLETHSVTESGRRLGLSQPAVSRALARLRAALDDELLVRTGRVMVPTPRALALQQPLREPLGKTNAANAPSSSGAHRKTTSGGSSTPPESWPTPRLRWPAQSNHMNNSRRNSAGLFEPAGRVV